MKNITSKKKISFYDKQPIIHYPKGTVFFVQRDEAIKLFLIKEGIVKLSIFTNQGEERIIEFVKSGRFVGAPDMFAGYAYGITATAYTGVAVVSFTVERAKELLGEDKEFSLNLAKSISRHSRALGKQLIGESFFPALGRVGFALQSLAIQIGTPVGDGERFILPISQNDLAQYVGCNRVTVTNALSEMVAEGIIEKKKRNIFIRDIKKLNVWLDKINCI